MPPRFRTILLALVLDRLVGEPPAAIHPVVWIGKISEAITSLEPRSRTGQLLHGTLHALAVVGGAALAGLLADRGIPRLPSPLGAVAAAIVLKVTMSLHELEQAAHRLQADLEAGDLPAARAAARALVSRPTDGLSVPLLASAGVESLAENAADSVVAPLLYYAWGGLAAALAYRAANTLDAMIGYHDRFEYSGKAAARLDDLLNLVPARLTAALIVVGASLAGGDVVDARRTLRRHGATTDSPNAGWPMSAMAGALGVRVEKPGAYTLGAPLPLPDTPAIDHAVQIVRAATILALPVALALSRAADRGPA